MSKVTAMMYVPMAQRHSGFNKPTIAVGYCTPRRCLVTLAASLVMATVIVQCLFSFRHAFSDMHLRTDMDGELVIVSSSIAKKHDAVCLDGVSQPGYYMKKGIDEGEDKWLLVIPHTEWCNSLSDCYSRLGVPLDGTMHGVPVTLQFNGILSSDPSENLYFADWNMVRLIPCDGSSFLGNVTQEFTEQGTKMRLRGAAILSAVLDHLTSTTNIAQARELVLYGKNSGAVAAIAHTGYIRRRLPYIPKFTTVLHSGLLFDIHSSKYDVSTFFHLHNIKGNALLSNCGAVSCLQADNLLRRPRTTPVIVYTTATPKWPGRLLYGCDDSKVNHCVEQGVMSKKYKQNLMNIHSLKDRPMKQVVTILSRCDWPIKTIVSNNDPVINGSSVYRLLVQSLKKQRSDGIYIEQGICGNSSSERAV